MNEIFNNNNSNKFNINKSQSKERNNNYFAILNNFSGGQNRYLSENQRNLTKFNSQKKIRKKESYSKSKNKNDSKTNGFIVSFNDDKNPNLKNYSNLITKTSKVIKNNIKAKNRSQCLSKPQLKIEINNRNNSNNISKNISKANSRKYKKNISEHDLNNILNIFTNNNFTQGLNIKLNFSSKKKIENDNKKLYPNDIKKNNQNKTRHSSDTKLLRSSSGYSYINSNLAQTNSFFNVNHSNQMGYISTWGNNPDWTNANYANMIKLTEQKKTHDNKHKNKSNKGPIIGKIIKNYKNNDLNCIFNMNVIPPVSPINNIQEYFKNMYKIEYNSDNRNKKNKNKNKKNKKSNDMNDKKDEKTKITTEDYTQSKNTMSKASDISKIRKEKESIDILKNCNDSPEEIHFYVISSIQVSKSLENNLIKK